MSNRNDVFSDNEGRPAGVDPRMPTMSRAEAARQDFDLEVLPDEIAPLPSGGKVYSEGHPLHGKDSIAFRSMTTKEENILTNKALIKNGTMISELLKSSIVDKRINPNYMLSGDRNALMVAIRASGYGADYPAIVSCPVCDKKTEANFDLSALEVKRLEIDPVTPGQNEFLFELPKSKSKVVFKFLTGKDEEDIQANADRVKKAKIGDPDASVVSTALFSSIVSVNGVTDRAKIRNFVDNLPARDSLALRNYMRENDPGLVMRQSVTCEHCAESSEVPIPIGVSFFWPQT